MNTLGAVMEHLSLISIIIGVIGSVTFPILYARWPWKDSSLGRALMFESVSHAAMMASYLTIYLARFPRTHPYRIVHVIIVLSTAAATVYLAKVMYKINVMRDKEAQDRRAGED